MRSTTTLRARLCTTLVIVGLLTGGCATSSTPANGAAAAVVEGETVYPTGSRISRVVRKGDAAGIAKDQPGGSTGTNAIEREANDFRPQSPISGR